LGVLMSAMKCIEESSCDEWNRACTCADAQALNASCAFDCGPTPECAKQHTSWSTRYLPAVLGSIGAGLLLTCVGMIWYRQTSATAKASDYDARLKAWKQEQQHGSAGKEPLLAASSRLPNQ
jgi:hypothetical protein